MTATATTATTATTTTATTTHAVAMKARRERVFVTMEAGVRTRRHLAAALTALQIALENAMSAAIVAADINGEAAADINGIARAESAAGCLVEAEAARQWAADHEATAAAAATAVKAVRALFPAVGETFALRSTL